MSPNAHVIKKAVISVSDKTGIVELATALAECGVEIYSTGGTQALLESKQIPVRNISALTGFPEILDGRVKTLHPAVHAGLLAELDKEEHRRQLSEHSIDSIDLLVVNLYPFEETLAKGAQHELIIENIDIGGPTMLRSAAKNYRWTAPVVDSARYEDIIAFMRVGGTIPEEYREQLACDVFEHTAYYDTIIAQYMRTRTNREMPPKATLPLKRESSLRYGENPHQSAALFGDFTKIFTKLHGKELSYNNIMDMDAASKLILEFDEPAVAIIKHNTPCGVAISENLSDAYNKAFMTDTVSAFGGIIAFNRTVDKALAETVHSLFTELLIAPEFTDEALEVLRKKKDRRLITADYEMLRKSLNFDLRAVSGGFLMQSTDTKLIDEAALRVVTKRQPTESEMKALMFGWRVCKHVKSNAIVFTNDNTTLGIGGGQTSRVDSARIAVEKSKLMNLDLKGSILASDAYFPFADSIDQAVISGATAIIQPGGSVRDAEVIEAADANNLAMVFTGLRHFRH